MDQEQQLYLPETSRGLTVREMATVIFRRRRFLVGCGIATLALALVAMLVFPSYKATMKILVQRDRQDPMVSSAQEMQNPLAPATQPVSEEDLNSEIELLTSQDVLRQVAVKCGLQNAKFWQGLFTNLSQEQRIGLATKHLARALKADVVNRANVIDVSYSSSNPELASKVLSTLRDVYLVKHTAVRRPTGQYEIFDNEAMRYQGELKKSEQALQDFTDRYGEVAPDAQRDIVVQKMNEFAANLAQTQAETADTRNLIGNLEKQTSGMPARVTTAMRHSDNPQLLEQLKSTLLTLQLRRTELLSTYQPDYRPVKEVESKIAETQQSIQHEENAPVREETTDQNPTHSLVQSELAKNRAMLAGLQARAGALQLIVNRYDTQAKQLDRLSLMKDDLLRNHKVQEQNYLLYVNKRAQARTGDLLDKNRILNVAIADDPTTPSLPYHNPLLYGVITAFAGMLLTGFGLFAVERFDPSFQTPLQIQELLGVPVLAAVPTNGIARGNSNPLPSEILNTSSGIGA